MLVADTLLSPLSALVDPPVGECIGLPWKHLRSCDIILFFNLFILFSYLALFFPHHCSQSANRTKALGCDGIRSYRLKKFIHAPPPGCMGACWTAQRTLESFYRVNVTNRDTQFDGRRVTEKGFRWARWDPYR